MHYVVLKKFRKQKKQKQKQKQKQNYRKFLVNETIYNVIVNIVDTLKNIQDPIL